MPEVILIPSTEGHWFNCTCSSLGKDEQIETITWRKDDQVFYTYTNSDDKVHLKLLQDKGITSIDDTSREGCVKLTNVNVNTTGCYKCEVKLTDGKRKVIGEKSTSIYLPHREGGIPEIEVFPSVNLILNEGRPLVVRTIGDSIGVKCRGQPSNPPTRLEIKINNIRQDLQYKQLDASIEPVMEAIDGSTYQNILYMTTLKAEFIITQEMTVNGFMALTCTSIVTSSHGFLEQQDSLIIRVRVLQRVQPVFKDSLMERQKVYLISIVFFVLAVVTMNQICSLVSRLRQGKTKPSVQRSI